MGIFLLGLLGEGGAGYGVDLWRGRVGNGKGFRVGSLLVLWALRDSNPRPSACKADALNQLS